MKAAIICDTHFGVRNDSPVFLEYFKRSLQWFFEEIDRKGITTVIHLGDLFDRRKYLNFVTAKACREYFLQVLEDKGIETHIITGNHDIYYKDTHIVNSLREIVDNRYDHVHVYDEPKELILDGTRIQLIPWITDSNRDLSYDLIKNTRADLLMGHFDIKGFKMHEGAISDHGDELGVFKRFDLVFSGHYHHKSSQDNIHYLGAFAEYTWSDYNDPRGFTIFDTSDRTFDFIKNPNSIFKMVVYDDVDTPDIMESVKNTDYTYLNNCYVKVVCVKRTNSFAFDYFMDKIYKVGPVDISVLEDKDVFLDESEEELIDQAQDTTKILDTYIEGLTLKVNGDRMKSFMRDVYKEALEKTYIE
jgi:DNA repair exonuclease SbcCD nuclease subunit